MKKRIRLLFAAAVFLCLIFPIACLPVSPAYRPTQDSDLAAFPALFTEDGLNRDYLSELGGYFEDHFAFRQHLISINSALHEKLFGVSASEQVILGKNGWMYYAGTMNDYLGRRTLSDRGVENAAYNLKLMQDYVESKNSRFLLAIAPNKNSVYDENMPYYCRRGEGETDLDRLLAALAEKGVHTFDLREAFLKEDGVLYLPQDSHWDNRGAALVYSQVMRRFGLPFTDYASVPFERRCDHNGDLAQLLYPLGGRPEENVYYQKEWRYRFVGENTDPMDSLIETEQPDASGVLLCYRDSFGSSLIPFFSDSFRTALYSRLVPYDLADLDRYRPDYTLLERAERTIAAFAAQPPVMPAPEVSLTVTGEKTTGTTLSAEESGGYLLISGHLDPTVPGDEICVKVGERVYRAFRVTDEDDYGYMLYLDRRTVSGTLSLSVLALDGENCVSVKTETVTL